MDDAGQPATLRVHFERRHPGKIQQIVPTQAADNREDEAAPLANEQRVALTFGV